jgi:5-methylthioribose kinase
MLDIENPDDLAEWLRSTGHIGPDEVIESRPLSGGVSSRTVLVQPAAGAGQEAGGALPPPPGRGPQAGPLPPLPWVLKQALPKLRVEADWFADPARVHREAMGIRWLSQLAPPGSIMPLVFEDEANHIIAMQAVPEPHDNWKTMLLNGLLEVEHIEQFAGLLATIHRRSFARRSEVEPVFRDRSFFESLRLEPYFKYSAEQVPAAAPFLTDLIRRTRGRTLALVHGDYSPKNILIHDERLILLDHEVIHFGDPAFDVGFSLTHLLSKAHHLPEYRPAFITAAAHYATVYLRELGSLPWRHDLEQCIVAYTLACMLARVAGRSPLEYLSPGERQRQQEVMLAMMAHPADTVAELVEQFDKRI